MELVDNHLSIETPEGVEFDVELAGIGLRMGAFTLDLMIRGGGLVAVSLPLMMIFSNAAMGIFLIIYFLVMWCYSPLFEALWKGQTPGKRAMGIMVINRDGTPVGWYGAIIRNLLRVADFLPFGYAVGMISMVVSGRFQRLGDLAGDTVVVYKREVYHLGEMRGLRPAEPVKLSVVLSPREQEALIDFSERSRQLGAARSEELAEILMPVTGASDGAESAEKLYGAATRIVKWG